jgi:hypothetical protein
LLLLLVRGRLVLLLLLPLPLLLPPLLLLSGFNLLGRLHIQLAGRRRLRRCPLRMLRRRGGHGRGRRHHLLRRHAQGVGQDGLAAGRRHARHPAGSTAADKNAHPS